MTKKPFWRKNVYNKLWEATVITHPAASSNGLRSDIGLAVMMFPPIAYNTLYIVIIVYSHPLTYRGWSKTYFLGGP